MKFFDLGELHIFFFCALLHHPHTSRTPNHQNTTTLVSLIGGLISINTCLLCHLTTAIRQPSSMDAPCCGVLHLVVLRSEQPALCSSMTKRPCSLGPTEAHVELIRGVRTCSSRSPWLCVGCFVVNQPPKHHHAGCWFRVDFWRNTARANLSSQYPMAVLLAFQCNTNVHAGLFASAHH